MTVGETWKEWERRQKRDEALRLGGVMLLGLAILLGCFLWWRHASAECSARRCPDGSAPKLTQRDGCLCVVEPMP